MNAGDWLLVKDGSIALAPLDEGEIVACGDYRFRVIAIPGHSAGSLAFYDEAKGILLAGDSVQSGGPIFMFGGHRNLDAYIASLEKLERLVPAEVTCSIVLVGHDEVIEGVRLIDGAAVPQCMPDRCGLYRAGSGGCTGAA